MAHSLRERREITVATAVLTALQELADASGVEILTIGGRLRMLSQGFVGPITEPSMERMTFDRAFIGADGVTWDGGICEADLRQTRLKELMMRRADKFYVLAHSAKLGQRPFHAWARMLDHWTLVTDSAADPIKVGRFRDNDIEVVVVEIVSQPERGSVEPTEHA